MDTLAEDAKVSQVTPVADIVQNIPLPPGLPIMSALEDSSVNAANANSQWRDTSHIIFFNCGNSGHY